MKTMKMINLLLAVVFIAFNATAQDSLQKSNEEKYRFTVTHDNPATPVKSQSKSGTCWSFAATSFIESELIRLGAVETDLSEMYFVNLAYRDKADRYIRYHGQSNYGPGGQAHDVMNVIRKHGFVTEKEYPGLLAGEESHNHSELHAVLKGFLEAVLSSKSGKLSQVWKNAYGAILDTYLGPLPIQENNTDKKNARLDKKSGFNPDDYVELTSYLHHPFYTWINLEIPDNWTYDLYYNIPLEELMAVMTGALENGFTVCWDGDVSDKGFSHANSVAILPEKDTASLDASLKEKWEKLSEKDKMAELYKFEKPGKEKAISPEMRQDAFDSHLATDDHLMHFTGIALDQNGTRYFITKNSWGANSNKTGGYLNISESYARMNTIAIMIHKDALPDFLKKKIANK
jgi:bleomycin hydrolase